MSYQILWSEGAEKAVITKDVWIRGYRIPRGFLWDGASIPTIFVTPLFLKPFDHRIREASLLHDFMYVEGMGRKNADDVFREICIENGLDRFRARVMWAGLRIGGWVPYRKIRRKKQREFEDRYNSLL